jgi:hypothetical protein
MQMPGDRVSGDDSAVTVEIAGTRAISIGSAYRPDKPFVRVFISPMPWHRALRIAAKVALQILATSGYFLRRWN